MDFLFVYDSMKSGFCDNERLSAQGFFVSKATTRPSFRLFGCGTFAALIKEENGVAIEGELWNIKKKAFKAIDEFEGVGVGLYKREVILLENPLVLAHTYLFCRATKNLPDCGSIWMKGVLHGFPTTDG
jgi:gamma-glutamylcyclotransferase (GGCT)/AIG2-like uncharacterized protein YtfP